MMKILVLGGDGMLGHQVYRSLSADHDVSMTLRRPVAQYPDYPWLDRSHVVGEVDARAPGSVEQVIAQQRPDAVINAIGIVKQRPVASEAIPSIEVNALLPHRIAAACGEIGARMIHMGTDCVFSGSRGNYTEQDTPDATDLYGRSKLLGEVDYEHCVTLRTSIIGLELARKGSLIEWYLAQQGTVKGFQKAIFSGFTTLEMSRIIDRVLTRETGLSGLWHVSAQPISKFDLLSLLAARLGEKCAHITPESDFSCDRSLDSSRFARETGYDAPSWDQMLDELAEQIKERDNDS